MHCKTVLWKPYYYNSGHSCETCKHILHSGKCSFFHPLFIYNWCLQHKSTTRKRRKCYIFIDYLKVTQQFYSVSAKETTLGCRSDSLGYNSRHNTGMIKHFISSVPQSTSKAWDRMHTTPHLHSFTTQVCQVSSGASRHSWQTWLLHSQVFCSLQLLCRCIPSYGYSC